VFAQGGDYLKLVQMLEARAQAAPPLEKAMLLRRIAELYAGPLDSVEMAYVWAARALEALPDDPDSLAAVLRYAKPAGAEEECAALLAEEVEKARGDEARVALQRALAQTLAAQGEPEQAAAAYRRLLELAPGDRQALDGLAAFYRDGGHWADLLEVLRRQLAVAPDGAARADLMRRIGELQDEKVGDKTGAIATFRRLLEIVPDDAHALERLDALCQSEERWAELADVLSKEISLAEKQGKREQTLTLKFRLAQVREQRLLDRSGAMTLYREVLQLRPGHVETIARLEVVFSKEPTYDEAADLLADAYRTVNNHGKLAKLLEDRAAAASTSRRASGTGRAGEDPRAAPGAPGPRLHRAVQGLPRGPHRRRHAAGAGADGRPGRDPRGAGGPVRGGAAPPGRPGRRRGVPQAGPALRPEALRERAGHQLLREGPRLRPLGLARRAAGAGPPLQGGRGLGPALGGPLLAHRPDRGGRRAHRAAVRLGQLAEEKLSPPSPDRAARAYEQILDVDPDHLPAARALERLYETAKRYDRLYQILELQQKLVSGQEKERITARMAEVAVNGLKDIERAIALYNEVLGLNPRSEAAFLALEGLYEDSGDLETLVELLRRRLSITVDPREITRLSDKVGRVLGTLDRDQEAIAAFRAALERDPRHKKALESLRAIYEKYAPSEDLVTVLRRLIPLQDDADGVKKVRLRLAEALAAMGRRDEAIEAARRVLDVEPHKADDLLRAEELFRNLKAWADQVRAMEPRAQLAAEAGDVPQATSILYSVAEVYTNALKKREAAAPAYERLLEIAPGERLAFDALREIYSSQVDWRRYANACERFIPGAQSAEERVEILKDLGHVQEVKLGHKDLAFLSFCRALPDAPGDEQVQAAVTRLAEETGSWDELATVYEDLVEKVPKGPLAEKLYLALADVHDKHLDQPDEAETALRKVLEFDPANHAALDALAQMFSRRGKETEYVVSLEQKYEAAVSIEERKAILKEIALTYQLRLQRPDEAATAYLRSLELEPDRETFRTLIDLYRAQKKWIPVTDVLIRARDFESDRRSGRSCRWRSPTSTRRRSATTRRRSPATCRRWSSTRPTARPWTPWRRLYTKLDRAAELLGVYDAELRLADSRERVKILFKTAGIWEDKYQNLENADACLEAVLAVDPENCRPSRAWSGCGAPTPRPGGRRWRAGRTCCAPTSGTSRSPRPGRAGRASGEGRRGLLPRAQAHRPRRADLHQALEINPRAREAMHALGILYERSGNWPFALDMLAKEAELLGASKEAVELFHRIGKINEEMLLDPVAAKSAYHNALSLDAGYLPSLRCLKGIYEFEKDWDSYLQVIIQEAEHTVDVEERAQAWLVVAHFFQDSKEDRDSAGKYYEEALKLIRSMEAALPLATSSRREAWEDAEGHARHRRQDLAEGAVRDPQVARLCRSCTGRVVAR
jgi:tetratricopeptide (TPR) repeat protein